MSVEAATETPVEDQLERPTVLETADSLPKRYDHPELLKPLLASCCGSITTRWHPSAVIYLYDTFGGYERATLDFCSYLSSLSELPEVIDRPWIDRKLQLVKDDDPFNPILGCNLADLVIGEMDNELLRPNIRWMLAQADSNQKYRCTKDELGVKTPQTDRRNAVWRRMQQHHLFVMDSTDGEYCRLRIKWWKFSKWWDHPDEKL